MQKVVKYRKSQSVAIFLFIIAILMLSLGYFVFHISFKEKKEKSSVSKVIKTTTYKQNIERNFFMSEIKSCIDSLVREGSKIAFNEILNKKKLDSINNYPVVFDGRNKVLVSFKDVKSFVEDYVKNNYYKCKNKYYNYKELRGSYVFTDLEEFELYKEGWYARIKYQIYNIRDDNTFEGEKDLEEKFTLLSDLLDIYNGLINYEASTRAMEYNLFTLIYHPLAYSSIYGYPTTNLIVGCRKIIFNLNEAKQKIINLMSFLISKYRVKGTYNSINVESPIFLIPSLENKFLFNTEVYFKLLTDKTKIKFSVVPGSSAYIRGNQLIVESNPYASLSPSQSLPVCSYDLFYDIIAPVYVEINYQNIKIPFIMTLLVNNNVPFNGTISEMEKDNFININPATSNQIKQCENNTFLEKYGKKVKVIYKGHPVKDAVVFVEGDPCTSRTNSLGIAYIAPLCIGCGIYAIKEGYISNVEYNDIRKNFILNLYKLINLHIWTIYTPQWLKESWGNNTLENLNFQGKDQNNFNKDQPVELLKLNTSYNLPNGYKEIYLPLRLNLKASLVYTGGKLKLKNSSFMTNGVSLLADVPYNVYYSKNNSFNKIGLFTFTKKNWFYNDETKELKPCELRAYKYREGAPKLQIGKEVILVRLSNSKIIEFPNYNGIYHITQDKTTISDKYLFFCIPKGVSIDNTVIKYTYDPNLKKWRKTLQTSFNSIFEPVDLN